MLNIPRYLVPCLLVAAALACALYRPLIWGLPVLLPLAAVAVYDLVQKRHALRRNYPLIARIRWLFEDLRPFLRAYIVESDSEGRPFSIDERGLVYARAKGDIDTHPMGTELDVYSREYEWLSHSIVPVEDAPAAGVVESLEHPRVALVIRQVRPQGLPVREHAQECEEHGE